VRKPILAVVAASLVTAVLTHGATRWILERPIDDEGVIAGTLRSAILGEDRSFSVHLPASYGRDPGRRYPVIYVLDGSSQHRQTADSAALLARIGAMPEVIVVGTPPVDENGRKRDYTPPGMRRDGDDGGGPDGAADRFLAFLAGELIPRIEGDYRTRRPRMLAGYSRGGLFTVYSLLAEPSLFDARFAHSPALWRDDGAILTRLERFLVSSPTVSGFLFLSLGDEENEKMTAAFERTVALLRHQAPPTLRWRAELTPGGNHGNNAQLATPVGLYSMFVETRYTGRQAPTGASSAAGAAVPPSEPGPPAITTISAPRARTAASASVKVVSQRPSGSGAARAPWAM
jgi:predicted alpha/beta superfamily hydrolase